MVFRIPEYQKLNDVARKYFTTEYHDNEVKEKMQFYVSSGIKEVVFLMKTMNGKSVLIHFFIDSFLSINKIFKMYLSINDIIKNVSIDIMNLILMIQYHTA